MSFTHLDDVLREVEPLGRLFAEEGYRLFLVGGIVRDQWLDEPLAASSDIDLTTNALPRDIKRIITPFAEDLWTQGERFGTIGLRAHGREYEITTHRAESYTDDSRKPVVSFGDNIEVDLSRRDFTVNAMAIELPHGELVDPYAGVADLQAGLLRTPLSADISFTDDPLRMLRAARFATRFSLAPNEQVVASAKNLHERLRIVAIERIGVELRRLLSLENAQLGLQFLADAGLLAEVLGYGHPAIIEQIPPRLQHAIEVVDQLPAEWRVRLASIGISVFDDVDGVRLMGKRLRLSRDDEREITRMARSALELVQTTTPTDEALRRWTANCDDQSAAIMLARAVAPNPSTVADFVESLNSFLAAEDGGAMRFIDGTTIMVLLGVGPGPVVGQAQAMLQDEYFARGALTESEQVDRLRSWWADRETNS